MKKPHGKNLTSLIAVAVIFGVGYATASFGAPSHGIKYTKHNFSTTGVAWGNQFVSDASGTNPETEICIFCHTPHNSVAGKKFLWNRTNTAGITFQMYTASPTLDFNKSNGNLVSTVSKMCLTCHDGAGAINAMANPRAGGIVSMDPAGDQLADIYNAGFGEYKANLGEAEVATGDANWPNALVSGGGSLVNDHPISFIYSESRQNDVTIKTEDAGGASVGGLPLWYEFLGSAGGYRVECVTCHDPHINYNPLAPGGNFAYKPFLRKSNYSSSLCFTCHDK